MQTLQIPECNDVDPQSLQNFDATFDKIEKQQIQQMDIEPNLCNEEMGIQVTLVENDNYSDMELIHFKKIKILWTFFYFNVKK